ncbi:hypothetical protein V5O48_002962 [Marasmius crinis-equi]|uniref:Uncharacterized protein n=1 Tax=Marasmius crinis-equi TaxID=585013 RepID=A0ABR3FU40_9AGAR
MPKATPPNGTQRQIAPYSTPPSTPQKSFRQPSRIPTSSPSPSPSRGRTRTDTPSRTSERSTSVDLVGLYSIPPTPPPTSPTPEPTWIFNFGRYKEKNLTIADVPWDYIQHLLRNGILEDPRRKGFVGALFDTLREPNRDLELRLVTVRMELPSWLYDAHFAGYGAERRVKDLPDYQVDMLTSMVDMAEAMVQSGFHKGYSPRPPSTCTLPGGSASVRRLRVAISGIPDVRNKEALEELEMGRVELKEISHDTQQRIWRLTSRYALHLKRCLDEVVTSHGAEGMAVGWWEVRDKYARCISGIRETDDGIFLDDSIHWLKLARSRRINAQNDQ